MLRAFEITMPADTDAHNLGDLVDLLDAVPTDGIIPDRVGQLLILARTGTFTVGDFDVASNGGHILTGGDSINKESARNTIRWRDYWIKGAAGSEVFSISIEAI